MQFLQGTCDVVGFADSGLAVASVFIWVLFLRDYSVWAIVLWLVVHDLLVLRCGVHICQVTRGYGGTKVESHITCFHLGTFVFFDYLLFSFYVVNLLLHLTWQPQGFYLLLKLPYRWNFLFCTQNIEIAVIFFLKLRVVSTFVYLVDYQLQFVLYLLLSQCFWVWSLFLDLGANIYLYWRSIEIRGLRFHDELLRDFDLQFIVWRCRSILQARWFQIQNRLLFFSRTLKQARHAPIFKFLDMTSLTLLNIDLRILHEAWVCCTLSKLGSNQIF